MPATVTWLQLLFGVLALALAFGVVLSNNPVVSAICLMGTLFSTAILYFALGAFFVGVVQITIYAGAIAVLFVFIVMLLDLKASRIRIPGTNTKVGLTVLAVGLFVGVCAACMGLLWNSDPGYSRESQQYMVESLSAQAISLQFIGQHMMPFQVAGFLILAGILGVVMLAKAVRGTTEGDAQ